MCVSLCNPSEAKSTLMQLNLKPFFILKFFLPTLLLSKHDHSELHAG